MKYFKEGLNSDELKCEYRKLAKKYHPDLNNEDTTEIMKAINNEYDNYFTAIRYNEIGYNPDDIRESYERARKERETILVFLRRDKKEGGQNWFTNNRYGKIISDGSESWKGFHGGFSVIELTRTVEGERSFVDIMFGEYSNIKEQKARRIPMSITFPTYAEMYFGLKYGAFGDSEELTTVETAPVKVAHMDEYSNYIHIHHKIYGDMWIANQGRLSSSLLGPMLKYYRIAYMSCGNRIMECSLPNIGEYETIETVEADEFGFRAFQDCTKKEFEQYHDTELHGFHKAVGCKELRKNKYGEWDSLWWVEDPTVAYFARKGIVKFYQSEYNFKMRYGVFDMDNLKKNIHLITIEEAEIIQDFLDDLYKDFDDHVKSMVKKGKIKISI